MSTGCAQQATDIVRSGRIGQVTLVEGRMHRNAPTGAWYYPIPPDASAETVDWKGFLGPAPAREFDLRRFFQWRLYWDYSGGLPTDLFVHIVTATHQVMGVQEPESVMAFGDVYHWKNYREVPDQMTAMAKYREGFVLQLVSTAHNGHPGPLLTFYGTEGTLEYTGETCKLFHEPRKDGFAYSTHSWPKATVARFKELMSLRDNLTPLDGPTAADPVEYRSPNDEDSTRAHVRNWIEAIRGGKKPIEDVRFGHHAALVGHMCNLSYKAGRPVRWNRTTRKVEV
jgi:predicted dehydrogenase